MELFNKHDQGAGADVIKRAMGLLYEELLDPGWEDVGLCGTVYDEIILEAPAEKAEGVAAMLAGSMKAAASEPTPDVPVEVEVKVCTSWAEK